MTVNFMNFVKNLSYMFYGMLDIFVVIGVIVVLTMILNKISAQIGKEKQ